MNNKPISIAIHDAKEAIVNTLNATNLPPSILLLLVKDIYNEVVELDKQTYQQDLESYNNNQQETDDGEDRHRDQPD